MRARAWGALLVIAAIAGCGAETSGGTDTSEPVTVRVHIANGAVTPTNTSTEARAGRPIVLLVDSDTTEELHVHSAPEHTFRIEAAPNQRFEFTVTVPGRADVELHHARRTVTTLLVRP
ncbi:hypothetical protein NDR87_11005 [Nocardia sp. CDC159]|uniref:EfeO-type cupredoxin-like domain-containing protein n=1 Tax=Nocardia pulmonis TaxID=2951408 RepID=A0A9X2E709_9NOCA|nr:MULTISPECIES: hypothetical protein [Nocardia]MCM6774000.1 hypothetical protein [Nocardia pulmonis]MCM6786887.1 hypothetical protein [Nocardia sp. CDC159]